MGQREHPRVIPAGRPLGEAAGTCILMHGRGAGAEDILGIAGLLGREDLTYLAPDAPGGSWYPKPFLAPREENEPALSAALELIGSLVSLAEGKGIPADRIFLLGFSQGACLVLEYAARKPRRYGGVFGFSGGLIGPPGSLGGYEGSLKSTPVFLGCSIRDPFIPGSRVEESAVVLSALGARVTQRLFPDGGHTVRKEEIAAVRAIMEEELHGA